MAELKYTEQQMQERLALARSSGREGAWRDLLRRFTYAQRKHIANLMAHDCMFTAVEIHDRYGSSRGRIEGGVPAEEALKALDEEKERLRAARREAAAGVAASAGQGIAAQTPTGKDQ